MQVPFQKGDAIEYLKFVTILKGKTSCYLKFDVSDALISHKETLYIMLNNNKKLANSKYRNANKENRTRK